MIIRILIFIACAGISNAASYYVATNGVDAAAGSSGSPWLTLSKAASVAAAGDTVFLKGGWWNENYTAVNNGSSGSPITIDGQGISTIKQFVTAKSNHIVKGLRIAGNTNEFTVLCWIRRGGHGTVISNCVIDGLDWKDVTGIGWENPSALPFSADTAGQCLIASNRITGIFNDSAIAVYGSNSLIVGNYVHDIRRADFLRLFGATNIVRGNTFTNNYGPGSGNHMDFIQTFGSSGFGSIGHLIERNLVDGIEGGQLSQLEGNLVTTIGWWTLQNNIFRNIDLQASCSIPGMRYINNTFYRCNNINGGHPLAFGGRGYDTATWTGQPVPETNFAHSTFLFNNAFLDCADDRLSRGWYSFSLTDRTDRLTNCWADFNYVAKLNYGPVTTNSNASSYIEGTGAFNAAYDSLKWRERNGVNGIAGRNPFWIAPSPSAFITNDYPSDFRLKLGSLLVNKGTNYQSTADFNGTSRDGTNDIGAFEWVANSGFYVSTNGSDAAAGSAQAPWLTVAKAASTLTAGQTVTITPGVYGEKVQESTSGSAGNLITYQSEVPHQAEIQAFRFSGQFIKVDGLKLAKFSGSNNTWSAAMRLDATSHNNIITNCYFTDYPAVIGTNFTFHHTGGNVVSNPAAGFITAGFTVGSKVYLGASGRSDLYYTNHDGSWIVSALTESTLTLTNSDVDLFTSDLSRSYWAAVRAGDSAQGFSAVDMVISGGSGPTNTMVVNNTITNWAANAIAVTGSGNSVIGNYLTYLRAFRFCDFSGDNHLIRGNIVKNSLGIIHYSERDFDTITHPAGTGWYDYAVAMLSGFTSTVATNRNIIVESNWFENIENQFGRIDDEYPETWDIKYRNNVFIGVTSAFSGGRDGMHWTSNTFYQSAFESIGGAHVLGVGGRPPAQTNYLITHNLFIDCGPNDSLTNRGFYSISTNVTSFTTNYNMVAQPELTGFQPKQDFTEANGINGGDPVFLSVIDFDGPDNTPFTADDGLKVLPNSPAASAGIGALGVYQPEMIKPTAHFRVTSPLGWFEATGTNYSTNWMQSLPFNRTNAIRPFGTAASFTQPTNVTFDASLSMSGMSGETTNAGVVSYVWTFGDGTTHTTNSPVVTKTFSGTTNVTVQLMVYNTINAFGSSSNTYAFSNGDAGEPAAGGGESSSRVSATLNRVELRGGVIIR